MSIGNNFNLEGFLRLNTQDFQDGADDASESMDDVGESAEDAADQVETNMVDRLGSVGKSMQKSGAVMSAAITAPMAIVGKRSIDAASDAEEAESRFNSVFENTADEVSDFAETYGNEIGRSDRVLQNMAADFGSMLNPMVESEEKAADLSTEFTTLTQDLASFENRDPAQVQNDLQSALAGQSEAVRKYGVDLSEARLKRMGLTEESTRAEEAELRLQAIVEDTASAQDNASETSDSYANQQRALRDAVEDLQVEIGEELLPIVSDLVDDAIMPAIDAASDFDDSQVRLAVAIGAVAAAVGPLLVVFGTLLAALPAIASGAGIIAGVLSGPLILGIAAVTAAGAVLAALFGDEIMAALRDVASFVDSTVIPAARSLATDALAVIERELKPVIEEFRITAGVLADTLLPILNDVASFLGGVFGTEWSTAGDLVGDVARMMGSIAKTQFAILTDILEGVAILLRGDFSGAWAAATDTISHRLGLLGPAASRAANSIRGVLSGVRTFLERRFVTTFDNTLGTVSRLLSNLTADVEFEAAMVKGALRSVARLLRGRVNDAWKSVKSWGQDAFDAARGAADSFANYIRYTFASDVFSGFQKVADWIGNALSGISVEWPELPDWLSDALGMVSGGIEDAIDWVVDKAPGGGSVSNSGQSAAQEAADNYDSGSSNSTAESGDGYGGSRSSSSSSGGSSGSAFGGGGESDRRAGQVGSGGPTVGLATGGFIERAGMAMLHAGERVVPEAQIGDRGPAPVQGGGTTVVIESVVASGRREGRAAGRALKRELKAQGVN